MFKRGDIVEIKEGAPYAATKPGTRWMVYGTFYDGTVRVGTPPINGYSVEDMVRLYGETDSRTTLRKYEAGVKVYNIESDYCRISGNNALFKDKLTQDDPWEEEKPKLKKLSIQSIRDGDWEDWNPWNR